MGVDAGLKIGIQGEVGSYSAEAASAMVPGAELLSFTSFADVYQDLQSARIDAAVLPFENTLVGSIAEQYDLLASHAAEIVQEWVIRIEHQVIGLPGAELSRVREVFSHPVALEQCRRFFAANPQIIARPYYDTAGSVAHIMTEGDAGVAAIASRQAAAHYGGEILAADVQDDSTNCTRFWLLRRLGEGMQAPDANKVTVLLELPHEPAALSKALADFGMRGFNLTRIESRPVRGKPFHYHFFLDFECATLAEADVAIAALRTRGSTVRVLGRYRAAQNPNG